MRVLDAHSVTELTEAIHNLMMAGSREIERKNFRGAMLLCQIAETLHTFVHDGQEGQPCMPSGDPPSRPLEITPAANQRLSDACRSDALRS